jgi:hypothetical protein
MRNESLLCATEAILAMAPAHLGGTDSDQAIVVAADAVDAVDKPQGIDAATAFHDLQSIVHVLTNPDWTVDGALPARVRNDRTGYGKLLIQITLSTPDKQADRARGFSIGKRTQRVK